MVLHIRALATVALAAWLAGGAHAQVALPGIEGKVTLVLLQEVRKELKITSAQYGEIEKAFGEFEANPPTGFSMEYMTKSMDAKVVESLDQAQAARLEELWLQRNGCLALRLKEVAERFGLDEAQFAQVRTFAKECDAEKMKLVQSGFGRSATKAMRELNDKASVAILAILTPEQSEAWTLALGKPFKFKK